MRTRHLCRVFVLIALAGAASAIPPDPLASYVAADPAAPAVTRANLLESERFWPYQLELVRPWKPPRRDQPLPAGTLAVLVRVESSGAARIDFGRDGVHEVPVDHTDLLERANRIRLGTLRKLAPNLVHAIGPRLIDAASEQFQVFDFDATFEPPGFLTVFADPDAESFGEVARALAPLRDRHGVMTVVFPQGEHPDPLIREKLRALDWRVPFLRDSYSEGYTSSLLPQGAALPAAMLHTREGRLVFQGSWSPALAGEIGAKIDAAFGGGSRAAAGASHTPVP